MTLRIVDRINILIHRENSRESVCRKVIVFAFLARYYK